MTLFIRSINPCMRRLNFLSLMALILALNLGCEKSFSAKVTVLDEEEKQDNNNKERDCNNHASAKTDKNYVVMFYNRLYANGKYYGEVTSGSEIMLDRDGLVYVNGEQRHEIKTKNRRVLGEIERIKKVGSKGDLVTR